MSNSKQNPPRKKTEDAVFEGASEKVKNFYRELSYIYKDPIKVTSTKREASDHVGAHSKESKHNTGDALDVAGDPQLYEFLMNDRRGLALLNKYEMGVLDETNPKTKAKTGATGDHFHIGTDAGLVVNTKKRYDSFENMEPVYSYNSKKRTSKGQVSPDEVFNYLVQKGVPKNHALGMLANIKAESNFNPTIEEKTSSANKGLGLFQHTASRRVAMEKALGSDVKDWKRQIDFALSEGSTKKYLAQEFETPQQASHWFTVKWEIPANKEARAVERQNFFNVYQKGAYKGDVFNPDGVDVTMSAATKRNEDEVALRLTDFDSPNTKFDIVEGYKAPDVSTADPFLQAVEKEKTAEQKRLDKLEASEAKRELQAKQEQEKALQEQERARKNMFLDAVKTKSAKVDDSKRQQQHLEDLSGLYDDGSDLPALQNKMPEMPQLFQFPELQKFPDGGIVSEIWEQKTGTPWAEAKRQGLTDGSYEKNIQLREKLLEGSFEQTKPTFDRDTYAKGVRDLISKGASLETLVANRVGTTEGLKSMFPELVGGQRSGVSSGASLQPNNVSIPKPIGKQVDKVQQKVTTPSGMSSSRMLSNFLNPGTPDPTKMPKALEGITLPPFEGSQSFEAGLRSRLIEASEERLNSAFKGGKPSQGTASKLSNTGVEGVIDQAKLALQNKVLEGYNREVGGLKEVEPTTLDAIGAVAKVLKESYKAKNTPLAELTDDITTGIQVYAGYAQRFLEKKGLIKTEDTLSVIDKGKEVKKIEVKPEVEEFFEPMGLTEDKYQGGENLWSYRGQWDNKRGFMYRTTPVQKDRDVSDKYTDVQGVGHFLLDASLYPGKEYSHDYNKAFLRYAKEHDHWIPTFTNEGLDFVKVKYKKAKDIEEGDIVTTPLRQMSFDKIKFKDSRRAEGFKYAQEVTKNLEDFEKEEYEKIEEKLKDKNLSSEERKNLKSRQKILTGTYLLFKDRKGYSRYSGGSVVFLFKDKYGNEIVRDFAGSINQIKKEAEQIIADYKLDGKDLTLGYHDVGSFSAKPAADKSNELKASQWASFNNEGHTGGALLVPSESTGVNFPYQTGDLDFRGTTNNEASKSSTEKTRKP